MNFILALIVIFIKNWKKILIISRICEHSNFIYRKKNGFRIPLKEWLKNKKSIGKYLDLLTDKNFKERGFFKNDIVEIMIKEHISDKKDWYKELFTLINFELWFRIYILKSLWS